MLTIYGSDLSSPANKVRFVANYLRLPYEYRQVNLREGEQKQEWFLAINPIGKVPAMKDNDFCLFESAAICKYLCDKMQSTLYPKELTQRAIVDQWSDFVSLHIMANVAKVMYNRVFAARRGLPVSQESISDGLKFLEQYLPYLETQLSQHKFLAGAQLTLADMTLLAALDPSEVAGIDLSRYPQINAWRQGLQQQPFYTQCYNEYGAMLKAPVAK